MSKKVYSVKQHKETSTPSTPDAGFRAIYAKSDGFYEINSAGVESKLVAGTISHTNLNDIGNNTHANIDTHIADTTKHYSINDSGTLTTELFSASKIISELGGKSNTGHTHAHNDTTGLQGGTTDEYYHITSAQAAIIGNTSGTNTGDDPLPLTTRGDIVIRNASNLTARLGIGTTGQVLTSDGADVVWAAASGGFADPMTTRGDIIIRNTSNAVDRLGVGTVGQVLTSDGTDVAWADAAGGSGVLSYTGAITTWTTSGAYFYSDVTVAAGSGQDCFMCEVVDSGTHKKVLPHEVEATSTTNIRVWVDDDTIDVQYNIIKL